MAGAKATINHKRIRSWVESKGGCPAQVKRTGDDDDVGIIRIDYPGYSGKQSLEKISWDDFFEKFEKSKLAFLYQDEEDSRFSKLVKRGTESDEPAWSLQEPAAFPDAFELLKRDHDKVKGIFKQIKSQVDAQQQFEAVKHDLETHTQLEEDVFYPALRQVEDLREMVEHAETEHGLVKQLLRDMKDQQGSAFENNFQALIANVQLHIEEEENQIFPRVREYADQLDLRELAKELQSEKRPGEW
jgi:hemerythrin superfamily protein